MSPAALEQIDADEFEPEMLEFIEDKLNFNPFKLGRPGGIDAMAIELYQQVNTFGWDMVKTLGHLHFSQDEGILLLERLMIISGYEARQRALTSQNQQ